MFRELLCFVVLLGYLALLLRIVLGIFPLRQGSVWGRVHTLSYQATDPLVLKLREALPPQPPGLPFPIAELVALLVLIVATAIICP